MSGVSVILLCEDAQTDAFVRRFLKHRNFRGRDVTTLPLPDGSRSGEQWVRERYPRQLQAIRQRQGACLIVVTDADVHSTEFRRAQLDAECEKQRIPRVQPRAPNGRRTSWPVTRRSSARSACLTGRPPP